MWRLKMALSVAVLVASMLVVTAAPALGARTLGASEGVPVDATACEILVGEHGTGLFEWRAGGVCWLKLLGWGSF
jgi:hypothetical protein